jgi:hypothetical protein
VQLVVTAALSAETERAATNRASMESLQIPSHGQLVNALSMSPREPGRIHARKRAHLPLPSSTLGIQPDVGGAGFGRRCYVSTSDWLFWLPLAKPDSDIPLHIEAKQYRDFTGAKPYDGRFKLPPLLSCRSSAPPTLRPHLSHAITWSGPRRSPTRAR